MKKLKKCSVATTLMCLFLASCATSKTYTVTWVVNGETREETYTQGETPSYKYGTPTKESDKTNTYTFKGWDKDLAPVSADVTYTAEFESEFINYTVTWIVDGTSSTEIYHYNDTPSYKGSTDKAGDAEKTYTFTGWDKELSPVVEDVTYTAVYDTEFVNYVITWDVDGTKTNETYHYGDTPTFKGSTDKAADETYTYTFTGWDKEITAVTQNTTYTATYGHDYVNYVVTWDVDGTKTTENYHYGDTPSFKGSTAKAADEKYTYDFAGWDKEIATVSADVTYTATYTQNYVDYVITWDVNGVKTPEGYHYGDTPSFKGSTEKEATEQYTYTFTGWDKEIAAVTENTTYTAQYSEAIRSYTITWVIGDKSETTTVNYGEMPASPAVSRESDAEFDYAFTSWDKEITTVTGNATYTALFNTTKRSYSVTFKDGDTTLDTKTLEYGSVIDTTGVEIPTKDGLTFYGWEINGTEYIPSELPLVTGAVEAKAVYKVAIKLKAVNAITNEDLGESTSYVTPNAIYIVDAKSIEGLVANKDYVKGIASKSIEETIYYSPLSTWDGTSEDMEAKDENTYVINNAKQFYAFATSVNSKNTYAGKTITLASSIEINGDFPVIGTATEAFAGTFDGNNCSIRGIDLNSAAKYTALFAAIGVGGTIKNISTYGNDNGGSCAAGLVGQVHGGTVDNATNYVSVKQNGNSLNASGGITGNMENGATITNSVNYGSVTGDPDNNKVAGIAGLIQTTTAIKGLDTVRNCKNFGSIKGSTLTGGIVGEAQATTFASAITECENYGDVTSISTDKTANVGGVVGQLSGASSKLTLKSCTNYGVITGSTTASNSPMGGVVGQNLTKNELSDVKNYGTVHGTSRVGGVVGSTAGSITNAENHGEVIGGVKGSKAGQNGCYIGGVVGVASTGVKISQTNNYGSVTSTSTHIGGVLGASGSKATVTIEGCHNEGNIKSSSAGVGGIAGGTVSTSSNLVITSCTNSGKVTGSNKVGGIVGVLWSEKSSATDCTNTGTVNATISEGTVYSGDIIGQTLAQYNEEKAASSTK